MPAEPLSCQELVELVTDYLEGTLPTDQRLAFEEHVAICPPCRAYMAQIRETVRLVGRLTDENIPSRARDTFLVVFRNWKSEHPPDRPET